MRLELEVEAGLKVVGCEPLVLRLEVASRLLKNLVPLPFGLEPLFLPPDEDKVVPSSLVSFKVVGRDVQVESLSSPGARCPGRTRGREAPCLRRLRERRNRGGGSEGRRVV